jgi:hypothetical protein
MSQQDAEFWAKAVLARQELIQQHTDDPNVRLIDLGYAPAGCPDEAQIVLRVFVNEPWPQNVSDTPAIQQEVNGIPVCIIPGDG